MILVLTPLQVEFDALKAALDAAVAGRVHLAVGGHGKVQFALTTQHLIREFSPRLVIGAGACGTLSPSLSVHDVVVGTETIEHDYNLRFVKRPLPAFAADADALAQLQGLGLAGVKFGKIASGDEDVIAVERAGAIRALTGADVVAWEGAGLARACRFQKTPFVEIRCVTDTADASAPEHFVQNVRTGMAGIARLIAYLAKETCSGS